jgi:hypothetical protein
MRSRAAIVGGTTCAVLALSASASGSHGPGTGGPGDFAVGSAKNQFAEVGGPNQLEVSAHRRSETDVSGYVRGSGDLVPGLPIGDFKVAGHVTCIRVEPKPDGTGTRASIKYRFEHTSGSTAPEEGGGVQVFIEDNGNPRNGQPVDANGTGPPLPPDLFEQSNPAACDDPNVAGQPYNPIDSGNYVVHDGPET